MRERTFFVWENYTQNERELQIYNKKIRIRRIKKKGR